MLIVRMAKEEPRYKIIEYGSNFLETYKVAGARSSEIYSMPAEQGLHTEQHLSAPYYSLRLV